MKLIAVRTGLLATLLTILGSIGLAQTTPNASGHWQGKIEIPDHELSITVDIAKNQKGAWIGSISVLGTGSIDVPLDSLTVEDASVRFKASLPEQASFEGKISADANSLIGTASNSEGSVPFKLTRSGQANVKEAQPSSILSKDFDGAWEGSIESKDGKVQHLALKFSSTANRTATAVLIAVDHGNLQIPVTTVILKDKQVQLDLRSISATYTGTLGANGEITGEWVEGQTHRSLIFKRVSADSKKP